MVTPLLCWEESRRPSKDTRNFVDRYTSITAKSLAAAAAEKARSASEAKSEINNVGSASSSGSASNSSTNGSTVDKKECSEDQDASSLRVHPTIEDMQMLLQAQFATIRHINSLSLMQKAFGHAVRCEIPVSVKHIFFRTSFFVS